MAIPTRPTMGLAAPSAPATPDLRHLTKDVSVGTVRNASSLQPSLGSKLKDLATEDTTGDSPFEEPKFDVFA